MKNKPVLMASLALALVLGLGAGAGSGFQFVTPHEGVEAFDLSELADGETRTFGEGDRLVTVTRSGDEITIDYPSKGSRRETLSCVIGESSCYLMMMDDSAPRGRVIYLQKGEGEGIPESIGTFTFSDQQGGQVMMLRAGGEEIEQLRQDAWSWSGPGAIIRELSPEPSVLVYECPEGDTTMRLDREDQDGPYFCPKHDLELVPTESHQVHREEH